MLKYSSELVGSHVILIVNIIIESQPIRALPQAEYKRRNLQGGDGVVVGMPLGFRGKVPGT